MDGTLVDLLPATEPTDLLDLVQQLRREVLELRQEVAGLRRENVELRQQANYWRVMHGRAVHRAEQLEAEVEQLRGENRKLKDQLFGRKSEKPSSSDRSNYLEDEQEDRPGSGPRKRGQRNDRPGPPRRDYSHLPVVEEPHELPVNQRLCPQCGVAFAPSNAEDSEQIEIEVRAYRRLIRRRRYQRKCRCRNGPRTITAPPPPKLIPKGLLGTSVWQEILLDKFSSHRPTERLLSSWRLFGLDVAAGTVTGGLQRLEPLFEPLYNALLERNARSAFAQADETRWMVLHRSGRQDGASLVAVGLLGGRYHGVPPGPQPKP
ncbi:MAG: IS66 family transposase [Planctomycetaceae bacterium]